MATPARGRWRRERGYGMRLLAWGLSDVGSKREANEDALLVRRDLGLFAVADGMGGHQGGARASSMAVDVLGRELEGAELKEEAGAGHSTEAPPARALRAAAARAGAAIYDQAELDPTLLGMGTTLTSLLIHGGRAYLGHVGDSRAYLYRDDRVEQLTEDHSWIEEQLKAGLITREEAETSAFKHVITRSVGFEREVDPDLVVLPFLMGDVYLLCSDGLSNYLDRDDLLEVLRDNYYASVPQLLVDEANQRGGDDNITCVLVYLANEGTSNS